MHSGGNQITNQINNQLNGKPLVNLASKEYFKSIKLKDLDSKVIQVDFKEWRDGKLKMIGFNAKRARGMMADYIVRERLNDPDDLKNFKLEDTSLVQAIHQRIIICIPANYSLTINQNLGEQNDSRSGIKRINVKITI